MGHSGPAGSLACLGTLGLAGEALGCCCFWVLHCLPWETSYLSSTNPPRPVLQVLQWGRS